MLVLFGVGITVGNLVGGRLSDWRQMTAILGGFGLLAIVLFAMPLALGRALPAMLAVLVWGTVHFAAGAPLQPRVVDKAHGANLAATLNQSAFNLGNALGATLGGLLLTAGYSYRTLPSAAGMVSVATVLLGCVAVVVERRERRAAAEMPLAGGGSGAFRRPGPQSRRPCPPRRPPPWRPARRPRAGRGCRRRR